MVEKLKVYQKAMNVAEEISGFADKFSRNNFYLADQLNRASLSISCNIAEGNGRHHKKERKQFFRIARASAHECIPLLEMCLRKNLIDSETHGRLMQNLEEISKMLSGLIRGLG